MKLASCCYKLVLEYKGTNFYGWQIQKELISVQGELNRALSLITKSDEIKSVGSGRTDASVHALGQVAMVQIPIELPDEAILKGVNSLIHKDIKIKSCERVNPNFHPIRDSISKEYNYYFARENLLSPVIADLIAPLKFDIDLKRMESSCQYFIGEHDFKNFYCTGSEIDTTIKTIYECELTKEKAVGFMSNFIPEYYVLRVRGCGFLKQMVRLMVGTLFEIGRGKVSVEDLVKSLQGKLNYKLGSVAPPQGLYLKEVRY
jgi:tRNA pseudouridine38-40 synthase